MIESLTRGILPIAECSCGIRLGIAIYEEGWLTGDSEAGGQINSRGRFPHTALLIGNRYNSGQRTSPGENVAKASVWMQDVSRGTIARPVGIRDGTFKLFHVEHFHLDLPGNVPRGTI